MEFTSPAFKLATTRKDVAAAKYLNALADKKRNNSAREYLASVERSRIAETTPFPSVAEDARMNVTRRSELAEKYMRQSNAAHTQAEEARAHAFEVAFGEDAKVDEMITKLLRKGPEEARVMVLRKRDKARLNGNTNVANALDKLYEQLSVSGGNVTRANKHRTRKTKHITSRKHRGTRKH